MNACPKCGDELSSFQFSVTMVLRYVGTWGSEAFVGSEEVIRKPKNATCTSCGARVDRLEAQGIVDGEGYEAL